MASETLEGQSDQLELLKEINTTLLAIQQDYRRLSSAVETIEGRVNILAGVKQVRDAAGTTLSNQNGSVSSPSSGDHGSSNTPTPLTPSIHLATLEGALVAAHTVPAVVSERSSGGTTSRIILTTYPGRTGIDPLIMNWGHSDPMQRGPVVVSRSQSTIRRRNGKLQFIMSLVSF